MGPEPCKQPGDGSADAARATGHDEHLVVQRVRREYGRLNGEFVVGEARLRLITHR